MEKSFRREIQLASTVPLDQDSLKVLFNIFKKRVYASDQSSDPLSTKFKKKKLLKKLLKKIVKE